MVYALEKFMVYVYGFLENFNKILTKIYMKNVHFVTKSIVKMYNFDYIMHKKFTSNDNRIFFDNFYTLWLKIIVF